MRWKIAEFTFCDQQQTLTKDDIPQQLEPMMVELLSYFCHNLDQIISKDLLVEQVWLGRIVSDNAVSKLITKLRKAFGDDARQPKFIATFPKKGYKFIASVEQIIDASPKSATEHKHIDTPSINDNTQQQSSILGFLPYPVALATLVALVVIYFFISGTYSTSTNSTALTHAKALTAEAGNDLLPSVSPDGTRVAYMLARKDRMHLMIKNISDERTIEIKHESGVGVGPANWSFDGKLLVYLVATPQRCQYFIREINGLTVGEAKLIHNCPAGSYGKIAFTHDNNRLVFAESDGNNNPYELFEINLLTEKITRLPQPALFIGGNSQFDMHPFDNKLLISSPDKQQWEGFYSLNLDTQQLTLLFKQDAYICCGIWNHDGTRVVLMGEYPAYQLLSYDMSGQDMKIIYSGSREISRPTRHTNGLDYLFSSGQGNTNIHAFDFTTQQQSVVVESSKNDRLATFAYGDRSATKKIAYVSLKTGNEEIWLTDIEQNKKVKLTNFNDSRHYVDLQWSPNNSQLVALTLNEIHLINATTGQLSRLKLPQTEIRAVSFKDDNTLSFSRKAGEHWQVYFYQIDTEQVTPAEKKWQYIQFTPEKNNTLWLDRKGLLYFGENQQRVNTPILQTASFLSGRVFNLQKSAQYWYWIDFKQNNALMRYSDADGAEDTSLSSNDFHFDVAESTILFGHRIPSNTDIYQTQRLSP